MSIPFEPYDWTSLGASASPASRASGTGDKSSPVNCRESGSSSAMQADRSPCADETMRRDRLRVPSSIAANSLSFLVAETNDSATDSI